MDEHKQTYEHSSYLEELIVLGNLKKTVSLVVQFIKKLESEKNIKFDSIAFRGNSGTIISVPVALALDKELIMVRKGDMNDCHSSYRVEGYKAVESYIILDDLMASGMTVGHIHYEISKFAPKAICVGMISCVNLTDKFMPYNFRTSWLEPDYLAGMYRRVEESKERAERDRELLSLAKQNKSIENTKAMAAAASSAVDAYKTFYTYTPAPKQLVWRIINANDSKI